MPAKDKGPAPRILVTGEPYLVRQIQRQLAGRLPHAIYWPEWKHSPRWRKALRLASVLPRVDVWYQLQGCAGRGWSCELALRLGVAVVLHWLGTDVTDALRYFRAHPQHLPLLHKVAHWTFSPWLADELSSLGLSAQFMPFPQEKVRGFLAQLPPALPETFAIATYIRDERPDFYGWPKVLALAQRYPDVPIHVLGTTGAFASTVPSNVRFWGWLEDPGPVLRESTVLVRMPEHDGYSGMVQEALALGRYVIWTYAVPGVYQARCEEDLMARIDTLRQAHQNGTLTLNVPGRDYVATHLHPDHAAGQIVAGLQQCGIRRRSESGWGSDVSSDIVR